MLTAGSYKASAADEDNEEEDRVSFEDWGDAEPAPTKCLFTDHIFDSVAECLSAATASHGLDLMQACACAATRRVARPKPTITCRDR